jgi:hypothetical protein
VNGLLEVLHQPRHYSRQLRNHLDSVQIATVRGAKRAMPLPKQPWKAARVLVSF